jgi:hypothetical protein
MILQSPSAGFNAAVARAEAARQAAFAVPGLTQQQADAATTTFYSAVVAAGTQFGVTTGAQDALKQLAGNTAAPSVARQHDGVQLTNLAVTSQAFNLSGIGTYEIQFTNTVFTGGSLQLQTSPDGGTTWNNVGSAITQLPNTAGPQPTLVIGGLAAGLYRLQTTGTVSGSAVLYSYS